MALSSTANMPLPTQVNINGDTYTTRRETQWAPAQALPDVTAEAVLHGHPLPAASREELRLRYEPSDTHHFSKISPSNMAALSMGSLTYRASVAKRTLDKLTQPGPDDPSHIATLRHRCHATIAPNWDRRADGAAQTGPPRTSPEGPRPCGVNASP